MAKTIATLAHEWVAADYSHGFTFAHADGCAHDD